MCIGSLKNFNNFTSNRKIIGTKENMIIESKRVGDTLKAFDSKFTTLLTNADK